MTTKVMMMVIIIIIIIIILFRKTVTLQGTVVTVCPPALTEILHFAHILRIQAPSFTRRGIYNSLVTKILLK
jgi:hypothetical protein